MENKSMSKSIDTVKVLQQLIYKMEKRKEENPEYIIRNIQLIDKIGEILNNFKEEMKQSLIKT
tara:strand:+ start:502 stop:690 length:189 start_codon:yes stop_codon:yes gene_type:complete